MAIGDYMKPRIFEKPGTNFQGIPFRARPDQATSHCPMCKGHGFWNHELNVYAALSEMKHKHSMHVCTQCNGSGWIWELHTHEWAPNGSIDGKCWKQWKCKVCGKLTDVDSGD